MNITKTFLFAYTLFLLIACSPKTSTYLPPSQNNTSFLLQQVLDSIYQANPKAIGVMAHVEGTKDKISWSGAAGFDGKENKKNLEKDQPVWIASNTKTYVAAAILRLVEQGEIRLKQPIIELLTEKTKEITSKDGYDLNSITVAHLLSHTSGFFDHVNAPLFFERAQNEPKYRWTRDELIALAMSDGEPLGKAGEIFSYSDLNFLLLTEIIEGKTGKIFYTAIRDLINYKKHQLEDTWFVTLEEKPTNSKSLARQFVTEMNLDSYVMDPSFDLYGGGGIAATTKDLARFSQLLFTKQLFDKPETLDLIYTKIKTKDEKDTGYSLGLTWGELQGMKTYGHGGFWGTTVLYVPDLEASISVFILERDQRKLRGDVLENIVRILK